MITGTVNSSYEIVVPFRVRDAAGHEHDVAALVDTGFTGALSMPVPVIISLGLRWKSETVTYLADNSPCKSDLYEATIIWDGQPRDIVVHGVDTVPMIGTQLLVGFDVRARFQMGGAVQIEVIP
mgnify:FL=1